MIHVYSSKISATQFPSPLSILYFISWKLPFALTNMPRRSTKFSTRNTRNTSSTGPFSSHLSLPTVQQNKNLTWKPLQQQWPDSLGLVKIDDFPELQEESVVFMATFMDVEPKIGVDFTPKMNGLFHGKPYFLMNDLGGNTHIFGLTPLCKLDDGNPKPLLAWEKKVVFKSPNFHPSIFQSCLAFVSSSFRWLPSHKTTTASFSCWWIVGG